MLALPGCEYAVFSFFKLSSPKQKAADAARDNKFYKFTVNKVETLIKGFHVSLELSPHVFFVSTRE